MGIDKEALDIWKFGRPRPDLSFDVTLAAPMPQLTDQETAKRHDMLRDLRRVKHEALAKEVLADPKRFADRCYEAMGEPTREMIDEASPPQPSRTTPRRDLP